LEEDARGTFWRGITIESDSRLPVGRAIAKTKEQVADALMAQIKARGHPDAPLTRSTRLSVDVRNSTAPAGLDADVV